MWEFEKKSSRGRTTDFDKKIHNDTSDNHPAHRVGNFLKINFPDNFLKEVVIKSRFDIFPEKNIRLDVFEKLKDNGFSKEDVNAYNKSISIYADRPINIGEALEDIYIAKASHLNDFARAQYNSNFYSPVDPGPIPQKERDDIIQTYKKQSKDAAYAADCSLPLAEMSEALELRRDDAVTQFAHHLRNDLKSVTAYRGQLITPQGRVLLDYFAGNNKKVQLDQFFSASLSMSVALDFAKGTYNSGGSDHLSSVAFKIKGRGCRIEAWLNEKEVVFLPETTFRITKPAILDPASLYFKMYGVTVFELEEVPKGASNETIPFLSDIHRESVRDPEQYILSRLLGLLEAEGNTKGIETVKRVTPEGLKHIIRNVCGTCPSSNEIVKLDALVVKLAKSLGDVVE